jgi:hypothetical protein
MSGIVQGVIASLGGKYPVNITVSSDVNNYDVVSAVTTALGSFPTFPIKVTVTVNSNVVIGSSSTTTYAFETTGSWASGSELVIVNNGYIVGAGGDGASGSGADDLRPGKPGGNAMHITLPTTITNNNIIGGGGGGSGRAGYGGSSGGRGAGGAGRIAGAIVGSGNATAGTLTYGGTTQYSHVNGAGNQPEPNQYTTYGSTLGQDGDVGGYGGLGGTGGYAIVGISNVTYAVQGRVHGRTS